MIKHLISALLLVGLVCGAKAQSYGTLPPGVFTNGRSPHAIAYSAAASDCGANLALGSNAFFQLTVGAASGFPTNCVIFVLNEDTTRGKTLAINGYSNFILWPQQTAIIYNDNNIWQISKPAHWLLPGNTTFNVDPVNGNDSNDCLATGTGACLTLQGAINLVANQVDTGVSNVTIQLANGTYGAGLIASPWYGNGNVTINGNAGSPSSVIVDGGGGVYAIEAINLGRVIVQNLKVQNAGLLLASALNSAWVQFSNIVFGNCATGGTQLYSSRQSYMEAQGGNTIASATNCANLIQVSHQGNFRAAAANTGATVFTFAASVTYSQESAFGDSGGDITFTGYTLSATSPFSLGANTVTGQRYLVGSNAVIQTLIGPTTFPGSIAGGAQGGGIYDAGLHEAVPGVNTCGTGPAINGPNSNDYSGSVTTGTGNPTACTVTFASAFAQAPKCLVSPTNAGAMPSFSFAANATQIGISWTGTGGSSAIIAWKCDGS